LINNYKINVNHHFFLVPDVFPRDGACGRGSGAGGGACAGGAAGGAWAGGP